MEIRKTRIEELDTVMEIYAHARQFMADHGNPTQWKQTWPPREFIENDIRLGKSYVCVEGDEIAAVFYFAKEHDETYDVIYDGQWLNDEEYAVVHRIASSGKVKGYYLGYGAHARDCQGCGALRPAASPAYWRDRYPKRHGKADGLRIRSWKADRVRYRSNKDRLCTFC